MHTQALKTKRVYGRRLGRPLNKERQDILDTLLPKLEIPRTHLLENANLPIQNIFETVPDRTMLEIGFGSGEHLAAQMRRHPNWHYIGAEPFINGMSAFLRDIQEDNHGNIRVLMDDAMMLANSLEDNCLDSIYVLNPDPWHKKRHHKRRIINQKSLDAFARILKPGGRLVMSSDVPDMAAWMAAHAVNHPAFEWQAQSAKDWQNPPENWTETRYQKKGAKGAAEMAYLLFHRK